MKSRMFIIFAGIALVIAANGFAQLSMAKADWARGPVQYLLTKEEAAQWNAVKSDAAADQFIALFWAKRDPSPATPQNEFRDAIESRIKYADDHFSVGRQRGSLTDRGKVLILFGAPTDPVRNISSTSANAQRLPGATSTTTTSSEEEANAKEQIWIYNGDRADKMFGAPHVELHFSDRLGNGDYRLQTPRIDFSAAQQRVITAVITQPNLTTVPTYQQPQPAPAGAQAAPAAPPAPAAPVTTLKTAALETALTAAKAAKPSNKAIISYAELVSPMGDYYVPVELYVPASAGLAADAADTFFGVIEDATGKRVMAFEEPAMLTATKTDFFVDRTLDLPSGKYTAVLGLAKTGTPVVITSAPLDLTTLTKESTGTSRLILSNNIYETQAAAPVKSPFAFGKLKIVPNAKEVFTNKDELGYFVEVHNPGIDTVSNLPKLQMKMDLLDGKGKTVAGAPLADAQALPLSGAAGPGQYAIINSIPLAQMSKPLAPGEYTLKMKIIDTITKQSYNLEQKFRIV